MVLKQMSPMSVILKKKKVVAVPTQIYYFSEEEINICFPKKYQRKLSLWSQTGLLVCGGGAMRLVSYEATGCITNYKGRLMYINFDIYR